MSIALPFLDDLIVMSKTIPKPIEAMKLVFQAYRNANLRLNPLKCHLFTESATYLGHVVTKDGLAPCRDYVAVVKDWPMPTTRTALRAFVGKISYYRKFIRNFAAIAGPLLERLKSKDSELKDNEEFPVTDAMRKAFEDLKSRLLRAPILAYPRFHQLDTCPFIVTTDWSADNNAIGGTLSQSQDGHERIICYAARRLSPAQRHYSATKVL